MAALDARRAYLDGEFCGVGPDGITSFSIVQLASDSRNAAALVFLLFDLLRLLLPDLPVRHHRLPSAVVPRLPTKSSD